MTDGSDGSFDVDRIDEGEPRKAADVEARGFDDRVGVDGVEAPDFSIDVTLRIGLDWRCVSGG